MVVSKNMFKWCNNHTRVKNEVNCSKFGRDEGRCVRIVKLDYKLLKLNFMPGNYDVLVPYNSVSELLLQLVMDTKNISIYWMT